MQSSDIPSSPDQAGTLTSSPLIFALLAFVLAVPFATAQVDSCTQPLQPNTTVKQDTWDMLRCFPRQQANIFTSPFRIGQEPHAWRYLLPIGIAAAFIPLDKHLSAQLPSGRGGPSQTISDVGLIGTGATVGGLYLLGLTRDDTHARETGLFGAEALLNSVLPRAAVGYAFGRYRPYQGSMDELGEGDFFRSHVYASSFPSGHATYTWAMISVLANEYPSKKNKIFWYAVGSTVAISRVTAREHFASDVIVGSALGYMIGSHIFHSHRHHVDLSFATDPNVR
jgi:membrane-associated phospholipid phosphatase